MLAVAEEGMIMHLARKELAVPLREDENGTLRVGDSNVILDIVIREFKNGADAESIAHAYSTLRLADVYAVIAYYLSKRDEVENYLQTRRGEAEKLRQEIEVAQPKHQEIRERLLKRRAQTEQADASPVK
jgi:uncharacterized protein (DUF433 family)